MKNLIQIISISVFLFTLNSGIAQESKSSLIISGSVLHFEGKQNHLVGNNANGIMGYYSYPMNSGLGILYQYQIFKENYLLAGIKYQACHVASTEDGIFRFRYWEPSISVQLKHYYFKSGKIGLFSTIGMAVGKMKSVVIESHGHGNDWNNFGTTYLQNYSSNNSFKDIIISTGVLIPNNHIEVAPLVGYRVNDNWISFYRNRFFLWTCNKLPT